MNPIFFMQQKEIPNEAFDTWDVGYEPSTWWGWLLWTAAASPLGAFTYLVTTIVMHALR